MASPDGGETARHTPGGQQRQLDRIAWNVLSDLLRPGAGLHEVTPGGFQQLIALRLAEEAQRARLPPEALAAAFERALREFTGAGRPPRPPAPTADPPEDEPLETVDDL